MKVTLLNVTPNAEDHIVEVARVSSSRKNKKDKPEGLLRYLVQHKHWSPFEHSHATFEIETSKAIGIQLIRHRSFSFQEFSQRYANPVKELQFVRRGARMQDPKNRQNSTNTTPHGIQDEWDMKQQEVIEKSKEVYNWAIDKGIAKEQARAVLPEGLTMSRLYVNGTLRSWVHFIELRSGHGTQKEHIDVAKACAWEIAPIFPMIQDFVTHD